jgi:dTDP-4-dehydrorhamnose 3,5-epimerase
MVAGRLPHGVRLRPLAPHRDDRGTLTEVFRASWPTGVAPAQWNCVESAAAVMRGVHIHLGYDEYYVLLRGRTTIGYRDVRRGSPTEGAVALVEVAGTEPCAVIAPPGIAHGIYFHEPSLLLVGVTREWDLANELGCHWRDDALEIPWPVREARLSARDAALPPLREVIARVPAFA